MTGVEMLEPLDEDWQKALAIVAHPDDLEFGSAAAIARWTGQGKEVVYCMLTQADHSSAGRATIDAVRDAANRWIFPDAGERWNGVRQVWAAGSPQSRHAVDTTATFDVGVQSLSAHKAYIDGLGWADFDPA